MTKPKTRKVYPHPSLADRGENLPGVGVDGAHVPTALADEWHTAGLAVFTRPHATGGPVTVRKSAVVGESGTETVRPARPVATRETSKPAGPAEEG